MKAKLLILKDIIKLMILFVLCTFLFYYAIKMMHHEYQNLDNPAPSGNAVKVVQQEDNAIIERLSIFFRLGE
ncbi:uncharacterized protein DUF4227 [Saliterribacillus persicus]|uniref:Uncharacterized protein DUF4227 n=1 Tax=Saliterribacillus persicus TaxID=930114 RepID=A0A368XA58_9BACI|nr:DUF4227 family protein [Saliterribacillus persicus]RCW64851.1 uncharacterized protein DUF4227 [Saliterribacillus persicus]